MRTFRGVWLLKWFSAQAISKEEKGVRPLTPVRWLRKGCWEERDRSHLQARLGHRKLWDLQLQLGVLRGLTARIGSRNERTASFRGRLKLRFPSMADI